MLEAVTSILRPGRPMLAGQLGLENLAVKLTEQGAVAVDEHNQQASISYRRDGRVGLRWRWRRGHGGGTAFIRLRRYQPGSRDAGFPPRMFSY